jgi:glycosyltransferase involved in cell wall biosynthesis
MKIAFDAKRAFNNTRGLGNYSRDTIRLLEKYYPESSLYLFHAASKNTLSFRLSEKVVEILPNSFLGKAFPALWRSYGICSQIKSIKPDLYHGLSQELPIGIQKTGIKSVVTLHDAIFMRFPEWYSPTYRALFVRKNKHACLVADRIIAISEQTKRDFIDFFDVDEKRIEVVYQGCSSIFRQTASSEMKKAVQKKYNLPRQFLLTVGAIEKRKNAGLIIEALYRKKMTIPLVVVGKPTSYLLELQSMVLRYRMEKQVLFMHDVETDDLPTMYSLADVFVYPSVFEGFGIPILEALCTGTPVITSKGSCFEETGGPFSRYIDSSNADELGEALSQILCDPASMERMRKEGFLFSEKFTDDKIAQQLMTLYQSIR